MFEYIKLEMRRTLRDASFVIFGIGMPVLMYLLFTNIGGAGNGDDWKVQSMIGMAAYGALGSALGVGTGVASDKSIGWLRQMRIAPLAPTRVVTGRAISGSVTVLPGILAVFLSGALINGVRLDAWQWGVLTLLLWIGALPFTMLGLGNGYRLSAQATGVVNVACLMGLAILGGLWFPVSAFPAGCATSPSTPDPPLRRPRLGHLAGPRPGCGHHRADGSLAGGLRFVRRGFLPSVRADRVSAGHRDRVSS